MRREGFGTRAVASPQPVEAAAKARTLVAAALLKKKTSAASASACSVPKHPKTSAA